METLFIMPVKKARLHPKRNVVNETLAQEAFRILSSVPSKWWVTETYYDCHTGRRCAVQLYSEIKYGMPVGWKGFGESPNITMNLAVSKLNSLFDKVLGYSLEAVNDDIRNEKFEGRGPRARVLNALQRLIEMGY